MRLRRFASRTAVDLWEGEKVALNAIADFIVNRPDILWLAGSAAIWTWIVAR